MTRLLGILLLGATALAHGASFDCAKARTPQEKAVCASPELSKADEQMAAAYERALSAAPPQMRDQVRDDQRNWMSLLPRYCPDPDPAQRYEGLAECLRPEYRNRTKELKSLVQHVGGVTFVSRTILLTVPESSEGGDGPAWQAMPGFGTLEASWPIAASTAPEWQAWNKAILDSAQHILPSDTDSPGNSSSSPGWDVEEGEDNIVEVSLRAVGPDLVTAHVEGTWVRGAHPTENYIELNWLLRQRRELRVGDVFRPGSAWEELFEKRCERYLYVMVNPHGTATYSPAGSEELAESVRSIVTDPHNWQISRKGIAIAFPEYAVAPRALHPGPVEISWDRLKPFLRHDFPVPVEDR